MLKVDEQRIMALKLWGSNLPTNPTEIAPCRNKVRSWNAKGPASLQILQALSLSNLLMSSKYVVLRYKQYIIS